MFDPKSIERIRDARSAWAANELAQCLSRQPGSRAQYQTGSGLPVERAYTPEDIAETPWERIGLPGQYPFTRGPYPTIRTPSAKSAARAWRSTRSTTVF